MWLLDALKERKNDQTPAIIERSGNCSFKALWEYSEKIAAVIDQTGKKTPVVIYGDKDIDILPTMIAAMKTGRAYVPVDISFPVERLAKIAGIVDACAVFNFSKNEIKIPFLVIDKTTVRDTIYHQPLTEEISEMRWISENDNAYILFTSGSTGNPKGVPITKSNLCNFESWFSTVVRPDLEGQNVLNQASYSFDASVEMLYVYLAAGKTLVCVDKGLFEDIGALIDWIDINEIVIWSSTPSFIDICSKNEKFKGENLKTLKTIIVGGEVFSKGTAQYLIDYFPETVVFNTYGPTEATVEVSQCILTQEMIDDERSIPIGKVMPEAEWYIEKADGSRCEDGEVGELVVISKSVAKGYYNDPEKTVEVFLQAEDGRMGYKTGDLVFADDDMLYFAGRKDFQVKLNGYRIEIEDISRNLDQLEMINGSAVIPVYDDLGKVTYLKAFVVLNEKADEMSDLKKIIAIKRGLSEHIPAYMIPRKIVFLDEFPLNVNGKIDRKALMTIS